MFQNPICILTKIVSIEMPIEILTETVYRNVFQNRICTISSEIPIENWDWAPTNRLNIPFPIRPALTC